ncbi:hypothetical protein MAPG_09576 [Magnaporthiopsis poae ATCC 64411]|uniref:Uncharacterized protein n=1 Tax=Magnaporthiopsis poae (strain ATCC 64411 / 73-15) TaxID=644358 RepID=A0A0C4EAB2_MAGP6|nr:hypothetical protein MAPG_09576 [Magnaporthiopsis poae ATCC 64411]
MSSTKPLADEMSSTRPPVDQPLVDQPLVDQSLRDQGHDDKTPTNPTQVSGVPISQAYVGQATEQASKSTDESNPTPCHVCDRMRTAKSGKHADRRTVGPVEDCILCARQFCHEHRGKDQGVCEINHQTYWENHKRREGFQGKIFSSLWHLEGHNRIKQLEAEGKL